MFGGGLRAREAEGLDAIGLDRAGVATHLPLPLGTRSADRDLLLQMLDRVCALRERAATWLSMTSVLSIASVTRMAIRRLVLVLIAGETTPAGRCVAKIRWIPNERPLRARSTKPSTNSGISSTNEANSSITMTMRANIGAEGVGPIRRSRASSRRCPSLQPSGKLLPVPHLSCQGGQRSLGEMPV